MASSRRAKSRIFTAFLRHFSEINCRSFFGALAVLPWLHWKDTHTTP
jgi:hypothetical protein